MNKLNLKHYYFGFMVVFWVSSLLKVNNYHTTAFSIPPALTTTRTATSSILSSKFLTSKRNNNNNSKSCRFMSSNIQNDIDDDTGTAATTTIRVLALHGSGGDAIEFPKRLQGIQTVLLKEHNVNMDIIPVQAPFVSGNGYCWWKMPPGIRSFTATEYEGFEISATKVLDVWQNNIGIESESNTNTNTPPFDLVLGHSQGAILIAALLALGRVPYHPKNGYVFNGVSFPNPYTKQMESLTISGTCTNYENNSNNNNVDEDTTTIIPHILFIMGLNDSITPNSTGEQLRDNLQKVGVKVTTIKHPGGHGIPQQQQQQEKVENNDKNENDDDDEIMKNIVNWIVQEK